MHLPETLGDTPPRYLGDFVATAKVKRCLTTPDDERHSDMPSDSDMPSPRDWPDSEDDMPSLRDWPDSEDDMPPLRSPGDRLDSDSDDDMPPLRSLSSSPPPPQ